MYRHFLVQGWDSRHRVSPVLYWDKTHFGVGYRKGNRCKVQEFETRLFSKVPSVEIGIEWVVSIRGKIGSRDVKIER